jgi:predicted pyridoxine 5'-phosphate oxidase superfamily flavin-nucleotide-binding protein
MNTPFPNTIASLGELRRLYREPSPLVQSKKMTHLDEVSTRFIIGSPFLLLGTSSLRGPVEVSPRGGSPGWVKVLDNTHLLIPDLSGTKTSVISMPNVWNPSSWPTLDKVDAVDILRSQLAIQTPKHELLSNFAQGYDEHLQADFQPQEEAIQRAHFAQLDAPET